MGGDTKYLWICQYGLKKLLISRNTLFAIDFFVVFALVIGGADSKEGLVGDISICGFDVNFVLCLRLY